MDEFHLLLKEEQTAAYSVEIWKRFRKWGGIPTAITQNIKDLLAAARWRISLKTLILSSCSIRRRATGLSLQSSLIYQPTADEVCNPYRSGRGTYLLWECGAALLTVSRKTPSFTADDDKAGGSEQPMKTDVIINREAFYALQELPSESVNCCVTSPPYYALRDYGLDAQIGREDTPEQYIDRLTAVFRELHRVLRKDGTFWLNIADTYCGTGIKGGIDPKNPKGAPDSGCKEQQKDLIGIPWLLAFSLREQGWYLRSDIIWQKQNPMPESCKDRPTRCYEHIFCSQRKEILL